VAAVPLWFQLSLIKECRERVERALTMRENERGDD
jgi:predicted ATPase